MAIYLVNQIKNSEKINTVLDLDRPQNLIDNSEKINTVLDLVRPQNLIDNSEKINRMLGLDSPQNKTTVVKRVRYLRYRKITYLPVEEPISRKKEQTRYIARIWKYKNIRLSLKDYQSLNDVQKERLNDHFISEISEIAIGNQLPFANLSETKVETLINIFEKIISVKNNPINNIALLDYALKNSKALQNYLEIYYKKKLIIDKFFLRDKQKKNKRRRRKFSKFSYLKRLFKFRRAARKGYLRSINKNFYLERINRRLRRLRKPQPKWTYGYLIGNIKRRNAFLTVRKKAVRKNKINKFEVRLSNIYKKMLKNFSIGQIKTLKVAPNLVLLPENI